MASSQKLLFDEFLKPEALFKTPDGLLIAQPDVSRQQYFNIEYDNDCDNKMHPINTSNKPTPKYQTRNSTVNINTSILSQLWTEEQAHSESSDDSDEEFYKDDDTTDTDDDDIDWKCCGKNIHFLSNYEDDDKDLNLHTNNEWKQKLKQSTTSSKHGATNNGLDAFLSDVLEETYHKKRNEAILLSMQRQNKSHIINSQSVYKQNQSKSFFSSSHHSKLCPRCFHIFTNPKVN